MTDIQQWRRMIQPARVRTPATETEDSDALMSPTTPRRPLKAKFSKQFTQQPNSASTSKFDLPFGPHLVGPDNSWLDELPMKQPDTDDLIETVMCILMGDPAAGLTARWAPHLMQIFESYRNLKDEKHQLLCTMGRNAEKIRTMELAFQREREDYKAEVKRLELILSKGKRGVAEVTLARQDSALRRQKPNNLSGDETLETIFEFLEKTKRYEDRAWSSQRATMRRRSPSAKMRRLSRNLATKNSMMSIHADLPFGTPPMEEASILHQQQQNSSAVESGRTNTLRVQKLRIDTERAGFKPTEGKRIEAGRSHPVPVDAERARAPSEPKTSISDDTFSTFSSAGDLLPDEASDANLIEAAGTDNDFVAVKRIADVLAKRRHVDPDSVMPKLLEMFATQPFENERSSSLPTGLGIQFQHPTTAPADRAPHSTPLRKHHTLKTKASGFFSKLRPQLNVDTSAGSVRRFSFEAGDDANASLSAPPLETSPPRANALPPRVRERILRKSASMGSLELAQQKEMVEGAPLSPVAQSPTASPPEWMGMPPDYEDFPRPPSRIPTPVYRASSMARPRDDSSSSLLTAIKHSEEVSRRSGSLSSSAYSSPSTSRMDLTHGIHVSENVQSSSLRTAGSNRLLEHTNALRGSTLLAAAAKSANATTTNVDQTATTSDESCPRVEGSRRSTQSRPDMDTNDRRKENSRPMRGESDNVRDSNATK